MGDGCIYTEEEFDAISSIVEPALHAAIIWYTSRYGQYGYRRVTAHGCVSLATEPRRSFRTIDVVEGLDRLMSTPLQSEARALRTLFLCRN